MLKKYLFSLSLFFVFGCKESLPPIDFGTSNSGEWLYGVLGEASIPAPENKTIVVEDLTGVRCVNCPKAAETANKIKEKYPDRVSIIGVYPQEPKNLTTPFTGFADLRTDFAQLVASNIFGFSNQLPGGGVNRRLFSGQTSVNTSFNSWLNAAEEIENEKSIVNLDIEKVSISGDTLTLKTDLIFGSKPLSEPFITILLTEDNIAHPQTSSTGTDNGYIHKHVLRTMYTPYNGSPVFAGTSSLAPERGVTATKTWKLTIPDNVNKDAATLVVFLNYNTENNKEIIQCKELKLK